MDHNNLLAVTYQIPDYQGKATNGIAATTNLENIISLGITLLSTIAIIFFIIQIILAGYAFMNSKGDSKNMEIARNRLTQSVMGVTITIVAVGIGALVASIFGIENIFNLNTIFTNIGL